MNEFIPPFPKRHVKELTALQTLFYARKDLLSIWTDVSFRRQFMSSKIFNKHLFIMNHPDLVKHMFITNHANYMRKSPQMRSALKPLLGQGLFISDGEIWQTVRTLQTPLFTNVKIAEYADKMLETIQQRVELWKALPSGSTINMLPEMAILTSEVISNILFGHQLGDANANVTVQAFSDYQSAIGQMALSSMLGLPDWLPISKLGMMRAKKYARQIHGVVDKVVEDAKKETGQDHLLADLLRINELAGQPVLNEEQIRNEVIVLFMAGHETTANTLAWLWYLVSQAPWVEEKMHVELKRVLNGRTPRYDDINQLPYIRAVLEETMRLYPPVPILARQAKEADVIRRKAIPAGSIVMAVPWLLHRHKSYWDKPDHFIPERFMSDAKVKHSKYTYMPFSLGTRVCIAKMFAMTEMVLVVATLMQHFRFTLPANSRIEHECRLTLRPKNNLPMTLVHK